MRSNTNAHIDQQIFRHTAVKSKAINVNPVIYRGGIRL